MCLGATDRRVDDSMMQVNENSNDAFRDAFLPAAADTFLARLTISSIGTIGKDGRCGTSGMQAMLLTM